MILPKTTDDLLKRFRSDVADPLEGVDDQDPDSENLWKTWELLEYMTEAADAVARKTNSIYKTFDLAVTANSNEIALPATILDIRLARLLTQNVVLDDLAQNRMRDGGCWDYGTFLQNGTFTAKGRPRNYVRDRERRVLVLVPIPTLDDTLELQCTVTISTDLLCGMPLPFRELPDVTLMLHYMKYLAYAKQDADTLDMSRSNEFLQLFTSGSVDREVDLRQQRRTPSTVRMEW